MVEPAIMTFEQWSRRAQLVRADGQGTEYAYPGGVGLTVRMSDDHRRLEFEVRRSTGKLLLPVGKGAAVEEAMQDVLTRAYGQAYMAPLVVERVAKGYTGDDVHAVLVQVVRATNAMRDAVGHLLAVYENAPWLNDVQPEGMADVLAMSLDEWAAALGFVVDEWAVLARATKAGE